MASKRGKKASLSKGLETRLRETRKSAEALLRSARKRVDKVIPAAQRKRIERLGNWVETLGKDLDRARGRAVKQAEAQMNRVVRSVETTAVGLIRPVVGRLDIATKSDVERLRKRLNELEARVERTFETRPTIHAA